jgi:hypothetical protein
MMGGRKELGRMRCLEFGLEFGLIRLLGNGYGGYRCEERR